MELEGVSSRSDYSSSRRIPGTPRLPGVVCSSVLREEGRVRKRLSLFILFSFSFKFVWPSMYWYCSIIFTSPFLAVVWLECGREREGGVCRY